jgi:hypothetical protein
MAAGAPGLGRRVLHTSLIAAAITLGGPRSGEAQDFQMFAGGGAGTQLACQPGEDPGDRNYGPEGTVGALWTIPGTVLAAGVQADICDHDGAPDARLGPRLEFRMPWQTRRLQPFAWIGYLSNNLGDWNYIQHGERAVVGGGVDVVRADGFDIRASVQDAFRRALWHYQRPPIRTTAWFRHEISVHVAAIWK